MASGFRLLVATLRAGTIDHRFGAEHVVLGLRSARVSGTLVLGEEDAPRAELVFESGRLRKARSTLAAYLGVVLYELGRIDHATLNASLAHVARERKLHGIVLRARLSADEEDVHAGLREQMERRLADLVTLPEGTPWRFHENEDRLARFGGTDWPLIDPIGGLWRGLRSGARESLVQATLARAGDHRFVLSPAFKLEELGLEPSALQLARSFTTPRRLVECGELDTSKVATHLRHLLVVAGALQVAEERGFLSPQAGARHATPKAAEVEQPAAAMGELGSPQRALDSIRALFAGGKQGQARVAALIALSRFDDSIPLRVELAWIEANGEGSDKPEQLALQIERFDRLIEEHPDSADAYYYRGLLFRRQGMAAFACRDLRMTLDYDRLHREATRDLRLFNARRERGASAAEAIGITSAAGRKRVG